MFQILGSELVRMAKKRFGDKRKRKRTKIYVLVRFLSKIQI